MMTDSIYDRNGAARQALLEIYRDYGIAGLDNDVVMNQLLPDQLPNSPREASAVRAAASVGVAGLLNARFIARMPVEAAIRDVAGIVMERHALDQFACLWIVSEYSIAIGHPPSVPISAPPREAVAAPGPVVQPMPIPTNPIPTNPIPTNPIPTGPIPPTNVDMPPYGYVPPPGPPVPGMRAPSDPTLGTPGGVGGPQVVRAPFDAPVGAGVAPAPGARKSTVTVLAVILAVVVLLLAVDVIAGWPPPLTGRASADSSPRVVVSTVVNTETVTSTVTATATVGATWTPADRSLVGKLARTDFKDCHPAPQPNGHVTAAVNCGAVTSGPGSEPLILQFDSRGAVNDFMAPTFTVGFGNCQSYDGVQTYWFSNANKDKHLGDLDCYTDSGNSTLKWSYYASNIVIVAAGHNGATLYTWWTNVTTTAII